MNSHAEFFSNVLQYLEQNYNENARPAQQYPIGLLQQIGRGHRSNECKFTPISAANGRAYQKYSLSGNTSSSVRGTERNKTIQYELNKIMPYYQTYGLYPMPMDTPKPNPMMPQFYNEFADWKYEKVLRQDIPPPPAKTTGVKHCKFCRKNGEHPDKYLSHQLFQDKELVCPILLTFTCDNCQKKGHTRSHCPNTSESQSGTSIVRILSEHNKPITSGSSSH